jgi:hypothetical protein
MIDRKSKQELKKRGSINPQDETFNFDLWAQAVRSQMIEVLERKLGAKSLIA